MAGTALALALAAAFLHACWNVLLARARDPEAATAVALITAVVVFAPIAVAAGDVDARVWPFLVGSAAFELLYFALLAAAYRRVHLSVVYPLARGTVPAIAYAASIAIVRDVPSLKAEVTAPTLLAGIAMFGAYALVLAALQRASAASVAAVRETSVVIATALAAVVLNEPVGPVRFSGAVLVATGIVLISLP